MAISNVVPPVQRTLEWMCDTYFGVTPFSVQPGVNVPIAFDVDNPREVGADRLCNAVAAAALYGPPLIVVDFGTATNFDCVNARGAFAGGAIAPGLITAADALVAPRRAPVPRGAGGARRRGGTQHRHQYPVRRGAAATRVSSTGSSSACAASSAAT